MSFSMQQKWFESFMSFEVMNMKLYHGNDDLTPSKSVGKVRVC